MEQLKVDMYIATNSQNFPEEKLPFLRESLSTVDESRWPMISTLQLQSPLTLLLISIFVGGWGVDRFMLGQTGLGVLKLLTGGGCGVWWLVDIFLVQNMAREANYNKLQAYLG